MNILTPAAISATCLNAPARTRTRPQCVRPCANLYPSLKTLGAADCLPRVAAGSYQAYAGLNLAGLGRDRYWILEIHLSAPDGRFGGFYERLLHRS